MAYVIMGLKHIGLRPGRPRDHTIRRMSFRIGIPLEPRLYLQLFLRYSQTYAASDFIFCSCSRLKNLVDYEKIVDY